MEIDYNLIGKRVAELRKSQGLSQEHLAETADISNNYLSHIETARSIPSLETLMKICMALQATPNDLLMGSHIEQDVYLETELEQKYKKLTAKQRKFLNDFLDILLTAEL